MREMNKWKQSLFIKELHWAKRVHAEVLSRESWQKPRSNLILRSIIFVGVISALFNKTWKSRDQRFIFVAFGRDTLAVVAKREFGNKVIISNNKLLDIAMGRSLIELDALSYLIHHEKIVPKMVRKVLIGLLLKWAYINFHGHGNNVFFVKEDYYGKASVLVSMSGVLDIIVAGIQHGLFKHSYLLKTDIYPGVRTMFEVVFDENYAKLMRNLKPAGTNIYVLGPPFERSTCSQPFNTNLSVFFISSGDLRVNKRQDEITRQASECKKVGIDFYCRAHPSERRLTLSKGIQSDCRPKAELLSEHPSRTIFIGYYSTLLYEAALSGFRTIWISNELSAMPGREFPEVSSLVDAHFVNSTDITGEMLLVIFNLPLSPQNNYQSLPARVEQLFDVISQNLVIDVHAKP